MQHKKLYRIYFTEFNDENFENIVKILKDKYNSQVNVIKSNVIDEFRAIELYLDSDSYLGEIKNLITSLTGSQYVRVDFIDTTR
ncbi:MAG: hypothetical protein ACP5L0_03430 [Caldisphaera sp.]|uniref:hypothetical protein n=1 Tax=Caldisphaera sp. TaxID=2060322 RepID=UPI003D0CB74B